MPRLAWLTDVHLDHAPPSRFEALCGEVERSGAEAVLLAGDIGEAPSVAGFLERLADRIGRPLHFVLGNHDFYLGGIAEVRARAARLAEGHPLLSYLSAVGAVPLNPETGLLGHDGWGDARLGDFDGSDVILNDEYMIAELIGREGPALRATLEALGDEAADHFRKYLPDALDQFRNLVVLTHVPPFAEACLYKGRPSGLDWLPRFSCRAVGDLLLETMSARPDRRMLVLCGHTHGAADVSILPNLRVLTGDAAYGRPAMQPILEVD